MIIQARFGSAQTGLGYQFYDATGALLGSRVTAGIVALPETGSYAADATIHADTVGVYWDSDTSEATEDLRDALASPDVPSVGEIADAVWDEPMAGHFTGGTAGSQLTAAGASGDPWASVVPAAYADGTAGAAIGRLNNTSASEPITVIPAPDADESLSVLYIYTESITNVKRAGIEIKVKLITTPAKSERVLEIAPQVMTTDADGFAQITVQRGHRYRVISRDLALNAIAEPTADTLNLLTLIP